jgi:hypothetical protein
MQNRDQRDFHKAAEYNAVFMEEIMIMKSKFATPVLAGVSVLLVAAGALALRQFRDITS